MIMKVELNSDEKDTFNSMLGMIHNEVVRHLECVQNKALGTNNLRDLECVLETLKKDTEHCLLVVQDAKKFMGENNG